MISGPRASKGAIATLKNVWSQKMQEKIDEEEQKVSIFKKSGKIDHRDKNLGTPCERNDFSKRD